MTRERIATFVGTVATFYLVALLIGWMLPSIPTTGTIFLAGLVTGVVVGAYGHIQWRRHHNQ